MNINRRQFLATGAALGASAVLDRIAPVAYAQENKPVKIARVDLYALHYPMTGYFKFFTGAHGQGRAAVVVKVTADNGLVGWGQSVPIAKWSYETLETAFVLLRDYYAPVLLGRDPTDIAGAHAAMDADVAPGFSRGNPITRAGVDIALHDLSGKLAGKSVAQLWGRDTGGPITLSWTVNVTRLDDVERVMNEGKARGFGNFNIKVAPDPEFDVELARLVRRNAPAGFLWADANGGYGVEAALAAAPKLRDAGVDVLEQPLKPNRLSGYQALKKQGALPVLMDEGVITVTELREFHRAGMLDGIASKPARCGGLLSNKEQIEYCLEHGLMWLGSGLTDPDISLAATLALYAAYGLKKPAALNGPQFVTADVLRQPLRIEKDQAFVPAGPGLGIKVDEEKLTDLVKSSGGQHAAR